MVIRDNERYMKLFTAIKQRFSCRHFLLKPVEEKKLMLVLKAATFAPSAGNTQDWRFCVIRDKKLKQQLAEASRGQDFISQAPVVVVVCSDIEEISNHYGRRGERVYAYQNVAAATENLLLAATGLGLAGCWVGAFDEENVAQILGLLPALRPLVLVPLGYPAEKPKPKLRKSLQEVVVFEK